MKARRRYPRFRALGCVLVTLDAQRLELAEVLDISLEGLGFRCINSEHPIPDTGNLQVYVSHRGAVLSKIPFRTVWDMETEDIPPLDFISTRRCGVRFGPLTAPQASALRAVIQNHTTADPES